MAFGEGDIKKEAFSRPNILGEARAALNKGSNGCVPTDVAKAKKKLSK